MRHYVELSGNDKAFLLPKSEYYIRVCCLVRIQHEAAFRRCKCRRNPFYSGLPFGSANIAIKAKNHGEFSLVLEVNFFYARFSSDGQVNTYGLCA